MNKRIQAWFEVSLLLLAINYSNASYSASFDCSKAFSKIEKAICASPQLDALDVELDRLYRAELERTPDVAGERDAVRTRQREWLRDTRNTCPGEQCLEMAYRQRVNALKEAQTSYQEAKANAEQEDKNPPPGVEPTKATAPATKSVAPEASTGQGAMPAAGVAAGTTDNKPVSEAQSQKAEATKAPESKSSSASSASETKSKADSGGADLKNGVVVLGFLIGIGYLLVAVIRKKMKIAPAFGYAFVLVLVVGLLTDGSGAGTKVQKECKEELYRRANINFSSIDEEHDHRSDRSGYKADGTFFYYFQTKFSAKRGAVQGPLAAAFEANYDRNNPYAGWHVYSCEGVKEDGKPIVKSLTFVPFSVIEDYDREQKRK
jgi:uncharacterized protein